MLRFQLIVKQMVVMVLVWVLILTGVGSFRWYGIMRTRILDVGQGDSILIQSPDEFTMLIDTGFDNSVVFQLSQFVSKSIDLLVLTHFDMDHVGGLREVLSRFEVGVVLVPYIPTLDDNDYAIIEILNEFKVEYLVINSTMEFSLGCCVDVNVLWPDAGFETSDSNDYSIVLLIRYKDFEILTTGDLSKSYEELAVSRYSSDFEVVKLGHHGSKTSTSGNYLEMTKPEVAVISSGKDNKYGHPHQEVLDLLSSQGIDTKNTADVGTISIYSDGHSFSLDY